MQEVFKAKGTELLKLQKYPSAIDKYTEAINIMNERIDKNQITTEKQMFELVENIKLPCLKNISLCYMKLRQFADCITVCDLILEIDSECPKTYKRKVNSYIELEQYADADAALERLEALSPGTPEVVALRKKWAQGKNNKDIVPSSQRSEIKETAGLGLVGQLVNFIMYWLMLPIRWTKYTCSFVKIMVVKIYFWTKKTVLGVSTRLKQVFLSIFEVFVYLFQRVVKKVVGPFNRASKKYLNISIPLYALLSGEQDVESSRATNLDG